MDTSRCEIGGSGYQLPFTPFFIPQALLQQPSNHQVMSNKCINPIYSNPDIAGIGIRINFYATLLLTALTPENEYTDELLNGLYTNSVINGLGLVITAVVQTMQGQLDLYHAIFVMQIIFSLSFVFAYGQRRFYRSSRKDFRVKIFILVQTFTTVEFTVWLLYVWIKDIDFGSQSSCNHLVKYVLFFANVQATATWLRVLFIAYLVINACALLFSFGVFASAYVKDTHNYETVTDDAATTKPSPSVHSPTQQSQGQSNPENGFRRMVLYINPSVIPAVYGVVTLELIVYRNRSVIQPGKNAWGFGQIISIILVFGSLIDMVVAVREWRTRKQVPPKEGPKSVV